MTTIAYKDGVMAADSAITADNAIVGRATKTKRVGDWLVAVSGDGTLMSIILEALQEDVLNGDTIEDLRLLELSDVVDPNSKQEDGPEGVDVLLVNPVSGVAYTAQLTSTAILVAIPIALGAMSIGSGAAYAMGAMQAGVSASEAVEIACMFDLKSAGPVVVL